MLVVYVKSGVVTKLLKVSPNAESIACLILGVANVNPAAVNGVPT